MFVLLLLCLFDCQSVSRLAALCGVVGSLGWVDGGRGFCDCPFLIRIVDFFIFGVIFRMSSHCFFVEGSILAQDERWRRA